MRRVLRPAVSVVSVVVIVAVAAGLGACASREAAPSSTFCRSARKARDLQDTLQKQAETGKIDAATVDALRGALADTASSAPPKIAPVVAEVRSNYEFLFYAGGATQAASPGASAADKKKADAAVAILRSRFAMLMEYGHVACADVK